MADRRSEGEALHRAEQREERERVYRFRLKGDENNENMDWVYTENRGSLPHDAGGNGLSEWEIQTFVLDTSEHASDPEAEEREELTLAGDDIESLREYKRQASMLIEELEGEIDRLRSISPEVEDLREQLRETESRGWPASAYAAVSENELLRARVEELEAREEAIEGVVREYGDGNISGTAALSMIAGALTGQGEDDG